MHVLGVTNDAFRNLGELRELMERLQNNASADMVVVSGEQITLGELKTIRSDLAMLAVLSSRAGMPKIFVDIQQPPIPEYYSDYHCGYKQTPRGKGAKRRNKDTRWH